MRVLNAPGFAVNGEHKTGVVPYYGPTRVLQRMMVQDLSKIHKGSEFEVEVFKGVFQTGTYNYRNESGYWFKSKLENNEFAVVSRNTPVTLLRREKYLDVPLINQKEGSKFCWAACTQMLVEYFNGKRLELDEIKKIFELGEGSEAGCNAMAQLVLQEHGIKSSAILGDIYREAENALNQGRPVVLDLQGN
jgi:hypothetical protein